MIRPVVIGARELADILHVDLDWIEAHRHLLPCYDVPSDDGRFSINRLRVRVDDLGEWKRATRQTR